MKELLFTLKGCSPTVEERARRLLKFELGYEETGTTVTVSTLFLHCHVDPVETASHLMRIPPGDAVDHLADWIHSFQIDGSSVRPRRKWRGQRFYHAGRAV